MTHDPTCDMVESKMNDNSHLQQHSAATIAAAPTNTVSSRNAPAAVRKWCRHIQTRLLHKLCQAVGSADACAAQSAAKPLEDVTVAPIIPPSTTSTSASSAPKTSGSPSPAVLAAIAASPTFLSLVHAVQHTHPLNRNKVTKGTPLSDYRQPNNDDCTSEAKGGGAFAKTATGSSTAYHISTSPTFFPVHMRLITLHELHSRQHPCSGNLYRAWSASHVHHHVAAAQRAPSTDGSNSSEIKVNGETMNGSANRSSAFPIVREILVGRVVHMESPSAHNTNDITTLLRLEDQTGSLPLLLCQADVSLLGRSVHASP